MSVNVLGISAFYHDSAAALVCDGEIVAAAQEERFSRRKHDPRFPSQAINYCLEEAFVEPSELDAVVYYDNPVLTIDRVIKNALTVGSGCRGQFVKACASMLGHKIRVYEHVVNSIGTVGKHGRILYAEHHVSHAASAFYPSPFKSAAILTVDGVGEWTTTAIGRGCCEDIEILKEVKYPHSVGLLYSAFTYYCGFKVNSGEYKLMGLAPYGKPEFYDLIKENLIDIRPDGSFCLNMDYFAYMDGATMTNEKFHNLFGGMPPRPPESMITCREMNIAASIQKVLEEVVIKLARNARDVTGEEYLVLAGGVALNCVANSKILNEHMFRDIWIQPAAGDAGGALGCALAVSHGYFGVKRNVSPSGKDRQKGSLLGPAFSSAEVEAFLNRKDYPYKSISNPVILAETIARAVADGKVVGLFSGRMEFGPRSLGSRSIIGDARRVEMQKLMNLKIKYRESFRPFAPSVLADDAGDYFLMHSRSPYMLLVAPVLEKRRNSVGSDCADCDDDDMLRVINRARSDIPAVTHVDYSARVQTVDDCGNTLFKAVLEAFKRLTGCSLVVNTSFNVRGEPIVCSPVDAYRCFMRTDMDMLVLETCVLNKEEQPACVEKSDWRKEYGND